jgi:hypothetical protein
MKAIRPTTSEDRYWSGIGVETKCESALTYYKKAASTGK